jgi:hypothetical protein
LENYYDVINSLVTGKKSWYFRLLMISIIIEILQSYKKWLNNRYW